MEDKKIDELAKSNPKIHDQITSFIRMWSAHNFACWLNQKEIVHLEVNKGTSLIASRLHLALRKIHEVGNSYSCRRVVEILYTHGYYPSILNEVHGDKILKKTIDIYGLHPIFKDNKPKDNSIYVKRTQVYEEFNWRHNKKYYDPNMYERNYIGKCAKILNKLDYKGVIC